MLDISPLSLALPGEPDPAAYAALAGPLATTLQATGFLYITGHGLPGATVQRAMAASRDFLQLEPGVKEAVRKGPEYQGWVEQGREIGFSSHNLPLSKSTIAFATEREDTESQYADELRRQAYIQTLGKSILDSYNVI